MNLSVYFNTAIGSCFIIILIAVDYLRKYNTDNFQRKLLIIILCAIFSAAVLDYIGLTYERKNGEQTGFLFYCIWSLYTIARNSSFYYAAVFIDYFSHGNAVRTKKFFKMVSAFLVIFSVIIAFNLRYKFFFYISKENIYMQGTFYPILLLLSYLPILLILIDISLAPKQIKRNQIILTVFFVILTAVGAALDVILRTTNIIWPCITSAILYAYFFIIRTDSKIDSLTGIGNRSSFSEYVDRLSKQSTKKEYMFLLINLDRFKEINDNLGHHEGDNALRDVAAIIKGCTRHDDFAVRFGSDEFIFVTDAENDIMRIIDRINNTIYVQNKKQTRPYQLYISYGYDVYTTGSGRQIEDFLSGISDKMNKYKKSHRENLPSTITADIKNQ
jgi:diguanylate cyclase (GGDEF)-like protein